jgi:hypothetical protein
MVIFKSINVLLYGCFSVLFPLGGEKILQILGISVAIWGTRWPTVQTPVASSEMPLHHHL